MALRFSIYPLREADPTMPAEYLAMLLVGRGSRRVPVFLYADGQRLYALTYLRRHRYSGDLSGATR